MNAHLVQQPWSANTSSTPQPTVVPRTRVRTGCLTCRKRKVKCDERRPSCWNCERLGRVCVFNQSSSSPQRIESYSSSTGDASESGGAAGDGGGSAMQSAPPHFAFSSHPDANIPVATPFGVPNVTSNGGALGVGTLPDMYSTAQDVSLTPMHIQPGGPGDFVLYSPFSNLEAGSPTPLSYIPNPNSFAYFLDHVDPPFITPFDSANWSRVKRIAVDIARQNAVVLAAVYCVETLYEAESARQDTTKAMSQYHVAKAQFATMLESEHHLQNLEPVLLVTFLLCCFEVVAQQETVSITLKAEGTFVDFLEKWAPIRPWPPVACRIEAWLKIFHTKALHLGGRGLLSVKVHNILMSHGNSAPTPSLIQIDPNPTPWAILFDSLSGQLFEFYVQIQDIGYQCCGLNRHHRSRGSPTDEVEVDQAAMQIRKNIYAIWQQRPSSLRLTVGNIRSLFQGQTEVVEQLSNLVDLISCAYWNELVDLCRAAGQGSWRNPTPEAVDGMKQLRSIVEKTVERNDGKVDAGFMWPIFFYGLEATDEESGAWAISRLREVRSAICRSEYAADLLQGVLDEQRKKEDRIDCRYLAFQKFGVPPPFI
ncbi:hypothetical protein NA57DRAFT_79456 [Rhizodiscina lignyota]|uniref:Zn(2)-C6 fungal-type domain-containing protein n=1 Tax=Rhizodiscina lignyota TaxID=1504668 RepID=A0A9P4IBY6_9PEZI|nr:hypothetical protein NA57DRAFT_79456 [Rhizodiscina lignyota]